MHYPDMWLVVDIDIQFIWRMWNTPLKPNFIPSRWYSQQFYFAILPRYVTCGRYWYSVYLAYVKHTLKTKFHTKQMIFTTILFCNTQQVSKIAKFSSVANSHCQEKKMASCKSSHGKLQEISHQRNKMMITEDLLKRNQKQQSCFISCSSWNCVC